MFRKVFSIILTSIFLIGIIVLGLHALHRNALAQVTYKVYVWYDDNGAEIPVTNAFIEFNFDDGGWVEPDSEGDGIYKIAIDDWADEWEVALGNWNWIPEDPDDRFHSPPSSQNTLDWEVSPAQ